MVPRWTAGRAGDFKKYTFGRNGLSAIEDLDARIQNRNVSGYDPDGLDMNTLYQGAFKTAADQLRSGQPGRAVLRFVPLYI